ncbi:hypothetical protein O181_000594 [Austropuccinia psidii MF-1]|uniref:Uncharacterized protein n=1 Tax=Austropuccinia psidii MF-1 TaxID=1389203 RepID=A0A9Q3B8T5_9BASI|nr:hypothetical protein [Austropuccinia psidii MF-1]
MPSEQRHRKLRKARSEHQIPKGLTVEFISRKCRDSPQLLGPEKLQFSRHESNESFHCVGPGSHQLSPCQSQESPTSQNQACHPIFFNPSPIASPTVREPGEKENYGNNFSDMMTNVRVLRVLHEVEKAFENATPISGKPYQTNQQLAMKDISRKSTSPQVTSETSELPTQGLKFNTNIFKPIGSKPSMEIPTGPRPQTLDESLEKDEEALSRRWSHLRQLERRATEASIEGLRKASLRRDSEKSQSTSGSDRTLHSPSRKFSFSRKSSSTLEKPEKTPIPPRARVPTDYFKPSPISFLSKSHPARIQKPVHREQLSPEADLVYQPVPLAPLQPYQFFPPTRLSRDSLRQPMGPRTMPNLSWSSDHYLEEEKSDILTPLESDQTYSSLIQLKSKDQLVSSPEIELISIPLSAAQQMVHTSNFLIHRKNSTNQYSSQVTQTNHTLRKLSSYSAENSSQLSLIEIPLQEFNTNIEDLKTIEVNGTTVSSDIETCLNDSATQNEKDVNEGSISPASSRPRFKRLSVKDGNASARDKRHNYMKHSPCHLKSPIGLEFPLPIGVDSPRGQCRNRSKSLPNGKDLGDEALLQDNEKTLTQESPLKRENFIDEKTSLDLSKRLSKSPHGSCEKDSPEDQDPSLRNNLEKDPVHSLSKIKCQSEPSLPFFFSNKMKPRSKKLRKKSATFENITKNESTSGVEKRDNFIGLAKKLLIKRVANEEKSCQGTLHDGEVKSS